MRTHSFYSSSILYSISFFIVKNYFCETCGRSEGPQAVDREGSGMVCLSLWPAACGRRFRGWFPWCGMSRVSGYPESVFVGVCRASTASRWRIFMTDCQDLKNSKSSKRFKSTCKVHSEMASGSSQSLKMPNWEARSYCLIGVIELSFSLK